jgi:uncharacterized membrane protein
LIEIGITCSLKQNIMESKAKLFGHPIHQMLIVFPLGLLATSVIFDIIYLGTGNGYWAGISYWMIAAGLISGLIAAVFGLIDWLAIPVKTRAKSVGAVHGLGNVGVVLLFAGSWFLRGDNPNNPQMMPIVLSFAGCLLSSVTAWLGGELVVRLGVGVDRGANLNAPNSISHPSSMRTSDFNHEKTPPTRHAA